MYLDYGFVGMYDSEGFLNRVFRKLQFLSKSNRIGETEAIWIFRPLYTRFPVFFWG